MAAVSIPVGSLSFNVLDEGSGPAVLLLHGFPDSSHLWRNQIPALVNAGFRVVAPDLRGFGNSDKPTETEAYAIPVILADVVGFLDYLRIERAHVIAHDWGAVIGWTLAAFRPDRVNRFVALSVGHPATYFKAGIEQRERSWYTLLFQFRGIAEDLLSRDDWKLFRDLVRHHSETEKWLQDLRRPGALTAALNWYRANLAPEMAVPERWALPKVAAPALGVWSTGDAYLTETQMLLSYQSISGPWTYQRIEGASHWMQLDQPRRLNALLLGFLTGNATV